MRLAVAGLPQDEVAERVSRLADPEWPGFSSDERTAFAFARRLTAEPWSVADDDVRALTAAFGRHRALDVIWHVAWGNYMTRFADAFQLQLESRNVFEQAQKK